VLERRGHVVGQRLQRLSGGFGASDDDDVATVEPGFASTHHLAQAALHAVPDHGTADLLGDGEPDPASAGAHQDDDVRAAALGARPLDPQEVVVPAKTPRARQSFRPGARSGVSARRPQGRWIDHF
jgi:hypothetical protein